MNKTMNLTLHVWRQDGPRADRGASRRTGRRTSRSTCPSSRCSTSSTSGSSRRAGADRLRPRLPRGHLRLLRLHDQRRAARPAAETTVCQLHMRHYRTATSSGSSRGAPRRSRSSATSSSTAPARPHHPGGRLHLRPHRQRAGRQRHPDPEGNARPAMDAAECIGCGACVAACPNASAMLFTGAKVAHLGLLPQGQPERFTRVVEMVRPRRGGLRPLHQPRRLPDRLPEGHQGGLHRHAERRPAEGEVPRPGD
jgi:ferredoxin